MHLQSALDRRRFGRRSCRVHGWIRTARRKRVPCVMTDYSRGGARLSIVDPCVVPRSFDLLFDGFDAVLHCEVRHADEATVGIEFMRRRGQKQEAVEKAIGELLTWLA